MGYVSEVSESQLESGAFGDSAKPGDTVGQKGVERVYDRVLRGVDGKKTIRVDSRGREIEAVKVIEPKPGNDLRLTIDIDIQRAAEQAFGDKTGAAVAVDPRSGEVLCLLSRPAFDPNTFATRISRQKWNELLLDPRKPMHNRAIQSPLSPGFGVQDIHGRRRPAGRRADLDPHRGLHGRHADLRPPLCLLEEGGPRQGRSAPCHRVFLQRLFYRLGRRLGIKRIADNAKAMGLGYKTGIDLLGEDPGLIPSPEWKQRIYKTDWYPGETISVAIGQGAVSLTPIQLARAPGRTGPGRGLQRTACRSGRGAQSPGEAAACCFQVESPSRIPDHSPRQSRSLGRRQRVWHRQAGCRAGDSMSAAKRGRLRSSVGNYVRA